MWKIIQTKKERKLKYDLWGIPLFSVYVHKNEPANGNKLVQKEYIVLKTKEEGILSREKTNHLDITWNKKKIVY